MAEAAAALTSASRPRVEFVTRAAIEVAPAVVTAVSTTVVSFLPVFFLTGRDQRLFAPLAWTKTFAIVASLIVAITLVPALCRMFLRSARTPVWAAVIGSFAMAILVGIVVPIRLGTSPVRLDHGRKRSVGEAVSRLGNCSGRVHFACLG